MCTLAPMAYCTECGNQVGDADNFCPRCGVARTLNFPASDVSRRRVFFLIAVAVAVGFAAAIATYEYLINAQVRERSANPNPASFPVSARAVT
jgi:hypothetical protein